MSISIQRRLVPPYVNLSFLHRYRKYGVDIEHINESPPLIVSHRNIVEYVVGMRPQIISDIFEIRKAVKKWNEVLKKLDAYGMPEDIREDAVAIAYMYPDIYILSSRVPKIPHIPDWFGYSTGREAIIVRKSDINNMRKLYISVLRVISRAVIVKHVF